MQVFMCKSKIHRAVITEANLNYKGSITIDKELLDKSNILVYEKVQIVNVNNGTRSETYVIEGPPGGRDICLNGAMARLGAVGDRIIIVAYALMLDSEARGHKPTVIRLDENNSIIK